MRSSLRSLGLAALALLLLATAGCASVHSSAQVNSGGSPHFGTSIDIPFGGGAKK